MQIRDVNDYTILHTSILVLVSSPVSSYWLLLPKYKETSPWHIATEKYDLENKSEWAECPLTQKKFSIIYSRGVHQPSSIRRFGKALPLERVLQRPAPSHLRITNQSRMRYSTSQPWRPAHGHTCDVTSPTKTPTMKVLAQVIWWRIQGRERCDSNV